MLFRSDNGIVSQFSAPGTPQQNGVAERRNRTLLDMVRVGKKLGREFDGAAAFKCRNANLLLGLCSIARV